MTYLNLKQRIKYYYWRLRKVTCEDCGWYYTANDEEANTIIGGCDFYGQFEDIEICRSSFQPNSKVNKLKFVNKRI